MAELELSVEDLAARRAAGDDLFLLDVREPWEFEICRIEGAVNIPLGRVPADFDPARAGAGQNIVVICHHGMRSLRATLWLRGQGVTSCSNLTGGIDRWAAVVEPTMARY
ncbi:sulfurtransferase [Zavarzinia compransoris]|uniref:rhodanese-like domain-containing protein n=1 Tax=Zavarzinia marina TaxID=2911065 RepID=UPI001F3FC7E2|nr:rhodanese-like domain-containing protein [Zavarzinia marina]MCF4165041.1 sulfurtransferase [Zavarzinia marina]